MGGQKVACSAAVEAESPQRSPGGASTSHEQHRPIPFRTDAVKTNPCAQRSTPTTHGTVRRSPIKLGRDGYDASHPCVRRRTGPEI